MSKYKWDNLILFVEQLATASKLQLPLDKTIASMSREALDSKWGKTQESVSELVRLGSTLSDAMDNYPKYFPGTIRRLVRVAEEGKVLTCMLSSLSGYLQSAREVQHRLQKCMIYPLIVWSLLLIDVGILVAYVFPKFISMQSAMGVPETDYSLKMLTIGPTALILIEGLFLLLAWILIGWLSADLEGKQYTGGRINRIIAYIPFLGNLHRHAKAAEVCEVLGILIEGGRDGREAVSIARDVIDNTPIQKALNEIDAALLTGEQYQVIDDKSVIPPTSLWMISESSSSPALGQALRSIAACHRRQVDMLSSILRELIEPLLLFSIAVLGGMTIVAFYFALFKFTTNFMMF